VAGERWGERSRVGREFVSPKRAIGGRNGIGRGRPLLNTCGGYSTHDNANNTVENIEALLRAARDGGYPLFLSPHYYYPSDRRWVAAGGALEALMGQLGVFARKGPLTLDEFDGSGADWPERFKPYLEACDTVVASPHKVYGTASNDLVLQLRKRRIEKVVLAGPAGNLCVEAHLRDFLEHGFEVAMVRDATAGTTNEEGDGYRAALVNFRFLAHALWTTREAVGLMGAASARL
jgi:nicotinamidase-related amidase